MIFIRKLQGKINARATKQASHAVSLYHELVKSGAKIINVKCVDLTPLLFRIIVLPLPSMH
ncbi:hypothetical protein BMS3Abin07_00052 [bacterium BMS3Abin07]|nr:hypothetical protein BMS3Abin07_00052 [bacterium BMS3Abin07]